MEETDTKTQTPFSSTFLKLNPLMTLFSGPAASASHFLPLLPKLKRKTSHDLTAFKKTQNIIIPFSTEGELSSWKVEQKSHLGPLPFSFCL